MRYVGDVVAGVTVAALVVPLSLGLAVTAGLPPRQGLVASALPMVVFAIFASSRRTMIGPDASVTALLVASVLPLAAARGVEPTAMVAATAALAGVICIVAAFAGAGRLARLLDPTTLVGYLAGLAIVVAVAQLPRITALDVTANGTAATLFDVGRRLADANWSSVAVGMGTCVVVLGVRRLGPGLPAMLVAVVGATVVTRVFGLDVHLIGRLPTGFPVPSLPAVDSGDIVAALPLACVVAAVTFADTLATATAFAARHHEPERPGRDLGALGAADLVSGVVGGMPVSASGARTAAAEAAGGTSQLTGVVAAAVLVLVLVDGAGVMAALPIAALGGVVVAAVVPMVDVAALARMRATSRLAFAGALGVAGTVVVVGVLEGIVVALLLSLIERRSDRRRVATAAPGEVPRGVRG